MPDTSNRPIPPTVPSPAQGQEVRFRASRSQAQGYHAAAVPEPPERGGASVAFRRSRSEPQAIVEAEKTQDASHGVAWRLKNAFLKSENAISTWMTLGFIKAWTDKTMGAWGIRSPLHQLPGNSAVQGVKRHIPALPFAGPMTRLAYGRGFDKSKLVSTANRKPETKWEKAMAVGVTGALVQNLAFFMTARGGELPEGNSMKERIWNSLRHPDKHSVHFSTATMSAFIGLIGVSRVAMGIQGMRGNEPDSVRKNAMMLVSGVSALVSAPLVFSGLFRMDKDRLQAAPDPEADAARGTALRERDEAAFSKRDAASRGAGQLGKGLAASLKPSHLKEMWQYAFKHDRIGLLGRALAVTMEMGFLMDGRMQLAKNPTSESAYKTVKGGLTGLVLTCMQTHFVYDRLLTNAKKDVAAAR